MGGVVLRYCIGIAGLIAGFCLPHSAFAAWSEAKSRHFIVYSDGIPKQLQDFVENLEKFDYLLRVMNGIPQDRAEKPILVYLLADMKDVQRIGHNGNIAGFYSTSDRNAYAVVARVKASGRFDIGAEDILFHEYAHHVMLHYFPVAYPAWYVEGFAEFYSEVKFGSDGSITFGHVPMARAPGLVMMPLYPLDKLFADEPHALTASDGDRYYGTAWALTHYFRYSETRGAEFKRYLDDVVGGKPGVTLDNHFAGGGKALEKDLRLYLKGRLSGTRMTSKQMPAISVAITPLEPARSALIEQELRLMGRMTDADRKGLIETIRAKAAKFPGSAYAQAMLAEAEQIAENPEGALTAADRAIAIDPTLARAHSIRADILLDRADKSDLAADWKAALSAIVKANRADTEDPVPLAQYYSYYQRWGGEVPKLAYDGLIKAVSMLPQSPNYRFLVATALANKRQYAEAADMLAPIAFSPHPSGMREAAIRMRDEFARGDNNKVEPIGIVDMAAPME